MGNTIATLVVAAALFTDGFLYGLVIPLVSYSPAHIHEEWMLGMMYTSYSLGVILATILFGVFSKHVRHRNALLCGIPIQILSIVILGSTTSFTVMLAGRILQGASAAVTWIIGLSLIAMYYPKNRGRMLGFVMTGSTCGLVIGPLIGGLLYDRYGYSFPFWIGGILSVADGLLRWIFIHDLPESQEEPLSPTTLVRDPSILAANMIVILGAWSWCILEALLPNYLSQVVHASPSSIGFVFTMGCLIYGLFSPIAGSISDRYGAWLTIFIGLLLMIFTLPLVTLLQSLIGVGVLLSFFNITYALIMNPALSELAKAIDRRGAKSYISIYTLYNITYSLGMVGSGIMSGLLATHFSLRITLLLTSGIFLFCFPVLYILNWKTHLDSPSGEKQWQDIPI